MHSWLAPDNILRFLLVFATYHRCLLLRMHWDTKTSALVTVSLSFDSITWLLKRLVNKIYGGWVFKSECSYFHRGGFCSTVQYFHMISRFISFPVTILHAAWVLTLTRSVPVWLNERYSPTPSFVVSYLLTSSIRERWCWIKSPKEYSIPECLFIVRP